VAVRAVRHLVDLGVDAGIHRDILVAAAGIAGDDLRDPDARVPVTAEIALWQTLAKHIVDPEFGVRAGAAWHLQSMGLVGYTVRFSGTLRAALHRLERYGRLFTEAVEFTLDEGRPEVALMRAHPALGAGHALAESYRLAALVQTTRDLTGADIVPANVSVTYEQPSSVAAHRQHFRCPLRFRAATACVVLRASDLNLPVREADETLAGYLSKYAEHVLARLVRGGTMRHRVRAAIWSLLGDGTPSLQRVAGELHLAPRTLQRRLAEEDTSLQQEVERMRQTMAVAVLRDRSIAINDVAFLLGYAEPSTFFRSFKRWTGTTPRRFRNAAA
jgi:AraC-like DNA-binding protein